MMPKCLGSRFLSSSKFSSKAGFDGIKTGDLLKEMRVFTNADVVGYSVVSHDTNPLHFDAQCARSAGFNDRLVHGIKIGDVLRETRVFTNADVVGYSEVSHDTNPLHFDAQCARSAGFEDRLVHGMLVASLFPSIIAARFPGAVYISQSLQFKKPVYVEEEIVGEVKAVSVKELKKKCVVKFSTRCLKSDLVVLDGEAMAILPVSITDERESNKD